jgi:predicted metal-dependent hydrolase
LAGRVFAPRLSCRNFIASFCCSSASAAPISLRATKNKWASYTQRTRLLIFNTELLGRSEEIGNYVIVHEILHSRVPNHGQLWKSLKRAHLGDYERQEEKLRTNNPQIKDLN